ncbi:hypothetical protein [Streptomyces coffeae]|nr:hypothetical protein [Streptomyces coffeae]
MVIALASAGYTDQVLLSRDVCLVSQLKIHGGGGFGFVHTTFREHLLAAGLDAEVHAHHYREPVPLALPMRTRSSGYGCPDRQWL